MYRKLLLQWIMLLLVALTAGAQAPAGYYDAAVGLQGTALQQALHNIIKGHTSVSYSSLHNYFQTTDKKANGKVWDMYSDVPGGTPPYQFTFISDKCGSYGQEGDCYNREHSFPKSWFGGKVMPMYTDLFHLYPTDGKVNGMRSSYPYGEVGNASWTSMNGSKVGTCSVAGYSGTVFEPIDAYKGDFARTYFYMAVRYYSEDGNWPGSPMVNGSQLKPWALAMLYQWHLQDTVSQKEIDRNNAVYAIQHNRNPFIDRPDWVDSLWFPTTGIAGKAGEPYTVSLFPNPAGEQLVVLIAGRASESEYAISLFDMSGRQIKTEYFRSPGPIRLDVGALDKGLYLLQIKNRRLGLNKTLKFIKQ